MNIEIDALTTLFLAVIFLLLGGYLKRKIHFLQKFCIPSPVVGGFLVSLAMWLIHDTSSLHIKFDTALQSPLMIAFFATVGIGGSLKLLKSGGKILIIYLFICWGLALFQNTFGSFMASILGINPVLGVMAGAVSLEGGHGAAATFGKMAEEMGVNSATIVAIASATFGLITGSLLGGPVANSLIKRHNLAIEADSFSTSIVPMEESKSSLLNEINTESFMKMLALILLIMVIGSLIVKFVDASFDFVLPSYVGAMLIAVLLRNLNDKMHFISIHEKSMELIANVSLGIFLTMAMMSLKIWELYTVALPLFIILVLQVSALTAFTWFIAFRVLGKNYDAAVMCAGLLGHGLGATPNAVANMSSVTDKYGVFSSKAFLIVPLCGAVLIDIVAIPYHVWIINFLLK